MHTIARFQYPENAWLFQSFLRDRDIDAYVFDEYVAQWQWTLSDAIGGVRVVVPWRDVEEACELWRGYHDAINRAPSPLTIARGGWLLGILCCLTGAFPIFGRRPFPHPASAKETSSADIPSEEAP